MELKCILGFHNWTGCKCLKCGKTREEGHDWSADCEKCVTCGRRRDNEHDWSNDCEKCATCGKKLSNTHNWNGCKCLRCGKTRDQEHQWICEDQEDDRCFICGATRDHVHLWDECKCSCGATKDHNWNGCKCLRCGNTREEDHDWSKDCEKCAICGKTRDNKHAWSTDCEKSKCSACGKTRDQNHHWQGDSCSKCGKKSNDDLLKASERGIFSEVQGIIAKGATSINAKDSDGRTALMIASRGNNEEVVRALLDKGAEVNAIDNYGQNALIHGIYGGGLEIVQALLDNGADVNVHDCKNQSVLKIAYDRTIAYARSDFLIDFDIEDRFSHGAYKTLEKMHREGWQQLKNYEREKKNKEMALADTELFIAVLSKWQNLNEVLSIIKDLKQYSTVGHALGKRDYEFSAVKTVLFELLSKWTDCYSPGLSKIL